MKELHAKLKTDAVSELTTLIETGNDALGKIAHPVPGIDRYSLARLIVGGRTASVEKAVVARMVRAKGNELLEMYSNQQDLPLDSPKKKKSANRTTGD